MSCGLPSFIYLLRKLSFKIKKIVGIVDKSPRGTPVILHIICVLLPKYEKSAAYLLKASYYSSSPPNTMLKIR